jgi:hypothetical protein
MVIQSLLSCTTQRTNRTNNMTTTPTISKATKRAIEKYGIQTCIDAYAMHQDGNGASTIAWSFSILKGRTNSGDAAINAGRELAGESI